MSEKKPKGHQRAAMLTALERGPADIHTLAERTGYSTKQMAQNVADFRRACPGVVYIMRWDKHPTSECGYIAVYAIGTLCSPEQAKLLDAKRPTNAINGMRAFLEANPGVSVKQISEALGRHPSSVRHILTRMALAKPRIARVSGYATDHKTDLVPLWSLGSAPDARRPEVSPSIRSQRYYERNKELIKRKRATVKQNATWVTGLL